MRQNKGSFGWIPKVLRNGATAARPDVNLAVGFAAVR